MAGNLHFKEVIESCTVYSDAITGNRTTPSQVLVLLY